MTQESIAWLNKYVVTGYGVKPFHYREGVSTPPFEGEVPSDVVRRLFPRLVERTEAWIDEHGNLHIDPDHKRIVAEGTNESMGITGAHYVTHQYEETICDMGLPVGSAGLLKGGRIGWVMYGPPDVALTRENVAFSVKLLAATSCDGSYATQYRWTKTLVVCDNTLAIATRQGQTTGTVGRARHTKNSLHRIDQLRREYGMLDAMVEDAEADIDRLIKVELSDRTIAKFLDQELSSDKDSAAAKTREGGKRAAVEGWLNNQFGDYSKTAFGLLQAFDSAERWDFAARGRSNAERAYTKAITGGLDTSFASRERRLLALI